MIPSADLLSDTPRLAVQSSRHSPSVNPDGVIRNLPLLHSVQSAGSSGLHVLQSSPTQLTEVGVGVGSAVVGSAVVSSAVVGSAVVECGVGAGVGAVDGSEVGTPMRSPPEPLVGQVD